MAETLRRVHETTDQREVFGVVGELGAVHFWIDRSCGLDRHYGGIEMHSRKPFDYSPEAPPSNEKCWLLDGPCWHDGSSLQAQEFWIPFYKSFGKSENLEGLWLALEGEYGYRFKKEPVAEEPPHADDA